MVDDTDGSLGCSRHEEDKGVVDLWVGMGKR